MTPPCPNCQTNAYVVECVKDAAWCCDYCNLVFPAGVKSDGRTTDKGLTQADSPELEGV